MSAEQMKAFLKKMGETDFRIAFETAATPEVKRQVLDKAGFTITVEEAVAAIKGEGELTDQDLDEVAGGDAGIIRYPYPPPPPPVP